jgi:hypothetical protein
LSTVPNSGNLNTVTRVFRETEGNVSGRLRVERTF